MNEEKEREDDWHVTYYLRRINRKMSWAFFIFLMYIIGKCGAWLKAAWDWLMTLPVD